MPIQLTNKIINSTLPKDRPYELRDAQVRGLLLRVQPSGHRAWIVTWAHGKRRTLGSVEHVTLEQAREQARLAVAEYVQSGLPALAKTKPTSCTLEVLLTDHFEPWALMELKGGKSYCGRIRTAFANLLRRQVVDIDVPTMDRWWRDRITGPDAVTKATAGRDFACLRSALSKAVEWRLIEQNPLLGIRQRSVQSRKVVRFLSQDEEARLRSALAARDQTGVRGRTNANALRRKYGQPTLPDLAPDAYIDHLTPVVLLAMNTGMRRGELLAITWADVNLEAKMLTIRAEHAKSGRQRHVPLNVEALDVLRRWRSVDCKPAQRVFAVGDIKKGWGKLLTDAGIEQFRFHDLRHHFASKLVRAGVDLNTVRELLGHADVSMTLRYAHLAPDTLAAAVEKLAA